MRLKIYSSLVNLSVNMNMCNREGMYNLLKTVSRCHLLSIALLINITVSVACGQTPSLPKASSQLSAPLELTIMTGEWSPFVASELPEFGFTSEIIKEASLAAGLKVSIHFAPWPRCEAAVKHGKVFASFPYSANDSRDEFAFFSQPIAISRSVFFYSKKKMANFNFSKLDELKPYLIGGVRGYYYEPLFKKIGLSVDYSDSEDDALKKLFFGRVALLPLNELVGWEMIRKLYPEQSENFSTSNTAIDDNNLNLMVSRNFPNSVALLRQFNEGLTTIIDNGVYKRIMEKHKIPSVVGIIDY